MKINIHDKKITVDFPKFYFNKIFYEKQKRIYDCFSFFNELDLLELRLEELYNHVDYFVIVEANKTFSGKDKDFIYEKNKRRFRKYQDKVIYVKINEMPKLNFIDKFFVWFEKILPKKLQKLLRNILYSIIGGVARYKLAEYQKRCIREGLFPCRDDDIILGIDIDEIPRPKKIKEAKKALEKYLYVGFELDNYRFYLNGRVVNGKSVGTKACRYDTFKNKCDQKIDYLRTAPYFWRKFKKDFQKENYYIIKNGGWHFSYLGDINSIIKKFESLEHPELDKKHNKNIDRLKEDIEKGKMSISNEKIKYVDIDKSFPETIKRNKDYYEKLIKDIT